MVNLLNQALRSRDVRKLVEPHLHEVVWDSGVDETSEWVMASFEDLTHIQKLESWLNSKEISDSIEVILNQRGQILTSDIKFMRQSYKLF